MSDDYLWDRSGTPDPEVERLERLLGSLRHRSAPLDLSRLRGARQKPRALPRIAIPLALAASIALLVAISWPSRPQPAGQWRAETVQGAPTLAARQLGNDTQVGLGEVLETDRVSTLRLSAGDVGAVEIGPDSRLRVVEAGANRQRFVLERGQLHATIWAAPGLFSVETPSATALDLGCRYTLEVDASGAGALRVSAGWVGLDHGGRESLVPAGASCAIHPGRGPGIPHFDDVTEEVVRALATLDASRSADDRARALDLVLREARTRDALTLWHLLTRLDTSEAGAVYDRLASLAPPPAAASRDRVLARDSQALDAWWDELGLGAAELFRTFRAR